MSLKHWKLLQLDTGGFADFDGSALSRVPSTDAAEGYYRHYYNTACTRPNAQAVIAGLDIPDRGPPRRGGPGGGLPTPTEVLCHMRHSLA